MRVLRKARCVYQDISTDPRTSNSISYIQVSWYLKNWFRVCHRDVLLSFFFSFSPYLCSLRIFMHLRMCTCSCSRERVNAPHPMAGICLWCDGENKTKWKANNVMIEHYLGFLPACYCYTLPCRMAAQLQHHWDSGPLGELMMSNISLCVQLLQLHLHAKFKLSNQIPNVFCMSVVVLFIRSLIYFVLFTDENRNGI